MNERIGEVRFNHFGTEMKIVRYENSEMLGKEWTREYYNDYVIWLENTLSKLLQQENDEASIDTIKTKLASNEIDQKDEFVEYLLEKDQRDRMREQAFLLDVYYIDDCDMNQFYFSILEQDGKVSIEQVDKIESLKLLLSEFLYLCGYDEAYEIQKKILNEQKYKKENKLGNKKSFVDVETVTNDGKKETITVFYGTFRNCTTWYAKYNKSSSKIRINKKGEFIYKINGKTMKIKNNDVVTYISKDYN